MKQALIVLIITATPMFGAPMNKTFAASCDRVWAAVKRATAPPHYNFAMLDDAQKKGVISTGNNLSGKRNLDLALSGSGETCTIAVGGIFSGLIHNDKGDLIRRIDEELIALPKGKEVTVHTNADDSSGKPSVGALASQVSKVTGTALTNRDVLVLKGAGLSDQLIIEKIRSSPASYSLETNDLVSLKQSGVSDSIVSAMIDAAKK